MVEILSDVLSSIKLISSRIALYQLSEPWGIKHPGGLPLASILAVTTGGGWLTMEAEPPIRLDAGDFVVFPRPTSYTFCSSLDAPVRSIQEILVDNGYEAWADNQKEIGPCHLVSGGGTGSQTTILGGVCEFADPHNPLVDALPAWFVLRDGPEGITKWTQFILEFILTETSSVRPGYIAIAGELTMLLFMYAVRAHIHADPERTSGWLRGISDGRIAKALAAVHRAPEAPWTLETLATEANMSRSSFSARFKELVGESPVEYLTKWRMHLAATMLTRGRIPISRVAEKVGYRSESVFSKTFKKHRGTSPGRYRRN
jgi:AraC-like DNA-binding protein